MSHRVTLIPGDGVGPEITAAARRIIDAAGVAIEWEEAEAGAEVFRRGDATGVPRETADSIARTRVALKGPLETPVGFGEKSANVTLRKLFETYANLAGFDADKVEIQHAPPQELASLLATGAVDVIGQFAVGEPLIETTAGEEAILLPYSEYLTDLYGVVLYTATETATENPDLVRRFTSALMRGLRVREEVLAGVGDQGDVTVEGHFVGKLRGLRFEPAQAGSALEDKALRAAAQRAVGPEMARRLGRLAAEPDDAFALQSDGALLWRGEAAGRLIGGTPFAPRVLLYGELGPEAARERAARRLEAFIAAEAGRIVRIA